VSVTLKWFLFGWGPAGTVTTTPAVGGRPRHHARPRKPWPKRPADHWDKEKILTALAALNIPPTPPQTFLVHVGPSTLVSDDELLMLLGMQAWLT